MAKIKRTKLSNKKDKQKMPFSFDELLDSLPKDVADEMRKHNIQSFEELLGFMLMNGIDPLKVASLSNDKLLNNDFDMNDVMIADDSDDDIGDDNNGFGDEDYLLGLKLPKQKFIGLMKREFHIRIKLNNAPVPIWRELVVPSNITMELLAYVLINAMGWKHEHLYQFVGKNNLYYVNSRQMKEETDSFMAFFARARYKNSEDTSLEMVLQPKGERLKFEYDFGDSWTHDLWVKGARDYAHGEEPVIKLIKAHGECPPEDCGGVWGYDYLLELNNKKRKSAEDKERLEWYDIPTDYDPEDCDLECLKEDVESLWNEIKEEM